MSQTGYEFKDLVKDMEMLGRKVQLVEFLRKLDKRFDKHDIWGKIRSEYSQKYNTRP